MKQALPRRAVLAAGAAALARPARAAPLKLRLLTNWYAEAEHGGFYQAKATGLYERAGLDVSIRMGGPQVNGMQLLTGGVADVIVGYDIQMLQSVARKLPVTTIAAVFQFDPTGIMTHEDVTSLAGLAGHRILISSAAYVTFWPWLKQRFGFTDDMAGVDTFNLAPFLHDPLAAMQGFASSEPFEARAAGAKVNFLALADAGYPPYSTTLVTTDRLVQSNPDACQALVTASLEGWRDYLRDPAAGNALIKADNPKQTDDRIAFAVETMRQTHILDRGGAGIGTMTRARWQATRDFLVAADLLKPDAPWERAFTTRFTDHLHITA